MELALNEGEMQEQRNDGLKGILRSRHPAPRDFAILRFPPTSTNAVVYCPACPCQDKFRGLRSFARHRTCIPSLPRTAPRLVLVLRLRRRLAGLYDSTASGGSSLTP